MIFNAITKLGSSNNTQINVSVNSTSHDNNLSFDSNIVTANPKPFQWKSRWTTYKSKTLYQANTEYY